MILVVGIGLKLEIFGNNCKFSEIGVKIGPNWFDMRLGIFAP